MHIVGGFWRTLATI